MVNKNGAAWLSMHAGVRCRQYDIRPADYLLRLRDTEPPLLRDPPEYPDERENDGVELLL